MLLYGLHPNKIEVKKELRRYDIFTEFPILLSIFHNDILDKMKSIPSGNHTSIYKWYEAFIKRNLNEFKKLRLIVQIILMFIFQMVRIKVYLSLLLLTK